MGNEIRRAKKLTKLHNILQPLTKHQILNLSNWVDDQGHSILGKPYLVERMLPRKEERIGFLDIECTGLQPTFSVILTACIKEKGGKIHKFSIDYKKIKEIILLGDYENGIENLEKPMLDALCKSMMTFDRIIVHWGKNNRFDIPYIRTKALKYGVDFPFYREVIVNDTYDMAKGKLKLMNNKLVTICRYFGIESKETPLEEGDNIKALWGDPYTFEKILQHNIEDVISTEMVWEKLIGFYTNPKTSI